jgi:hypothetical protein
VARICVYRSADPEWSARSAASRSSRFKIFLKAFVWDAINGGLGHGGVLEERGLHRAAADVLAPAHHQILGAKVSALASGRFQ